MRIPHQIKSDVRISTVPNWTILTVYNFTRPKYAASSTVQWGSKVLIYRTQTGSYVMTHDTTKVMSTKRVTNKPSDGNSVSGPCKLSNVGALYSMCGYRTGGDFQNNPVHRLASKTLIPVDRSRQPKPHCLAFSTGLLKRVLLLFFVVLVDLEGSNSKESLIYISCLLFSPL